MSRICPVTARSAPQW